MNEFERLLSHLQELEVEFTARLGPEVEAPSPADLLEIAANRDKWWAEKLGLRVSDIQAWRDSWDDRERAVIRCGAKTKSGRPCRNIVFEWGGPREFAAFVNHGCVVHGGPPPSRY